jgi:hypothetical protein
MLQTAALFAQFGNDSVQRSRLQAQVRPESGGAFMHHETDHVHCTASMILS